MFRFTSNLNSSGQLRGGAGGPNETQVVRKADFPPIPLIPSIHLCRTPCGTGVRERRAGLSRTHVGFAHPLPEGSQTKWIFKSASVDKNPPTPTRASFWSTASPQVGAVKPNKGSHVQGQTVQIPAHTYTPKAGEICATSRSRTTICTNRNHRLE